MTEGERLSGELLRVLAIIHAFSCAHDRPTETTHNRVAVRATRLALYS